MQDYSPFDRESGGYATILEWRNIYYEEKPRLIGRSKPVLRLGVVQWQMRPLPSLEELLEQLEFFVDAVAGYNADVLLLPELVHAPLMTLTAKPSASLAMRELAARLIRQGAELLLTPFWADTRIAYLRLRHCGAGGTYPVDMKPDCLTCATTSALAHVGVTAQGGMLTTMVTCVSGNADAPMQNRALFIGGTYTTSTGQPGLKWTFNPPAQMVGFSAVPTASTAKPIVTLRGYNAVGAVIGEDSFDFAAAPGGSCATLNPAVQFFGFRPCLGQEMTEVEIIVSDANVAIDEVRVVFSGP